MTDPRDAARLALTRLPAPVAQRLQRALDDGTYGACAQCGDPISDAVLLQRPETALCATCTSDLTARQQGRRFGVCGVRPTSS